MREREGGREKERHLAVSPGVFAFCLYTHLGYSTFGSDRFRCRAVDPVWLFQLFGLYTNSEFFFWFFFVVVYTFFSSMCVVFCECRFCVLRHFIFILTGEQTHLNILDVCCICYTGVWVCMCVFLWVRFLSHQLTRCASLFKSQRISIAAHRPSFTHLSLFSLSLSLTRTLFFCLVNSEKTVLFWPFWLANFGCIASAFSPTLLAVSLCFGENWLPAIMAATYTYTHKHRHTDTQTLLYYTNLLAVSVFSIRPALRF